MLLSLKLSSKRVAALARIAAKNESEKNETSVEQRTFACNSFFISFLVSVFCIVNLCTNEYSIVFCIFFMLLFFLLFLSFLFLSYDLFLLTSCVLVFVVVKLSRVECQKIQNSITLDSLIS